MEVPVYKLRCELRGHTEDVRSLCVAAPGLLTGSRDRTIKLWTERAGQHELDLDTTFVGHNDFVSALAYIPPGAAEAYPNGAVVSGSRDASVIVWDPTTAAPLQILEGHQYQVSAVVATPEGDIYSASLDKTIRHWRGGQCVEVLTGHEAAVLCLLLLPNGDLVSGSGDCTVRVWSGGRCTHTIAAHSDSVRGLALLPGVGVISASHDQTLKIWTFSGECISELVGHTALVYSVAATEEGLIASGSEDNTLRLWRADGTCLQTIEHPGNLWDVAFLASGDVVTGCSDHAARVWSADPTRQAPAEVQEAYEQVMQARKDAAAAAAAAGADAAAPSGLKLEDPSVLMTPGSKDGKVVVVREGGAGVAYSWDTGKGEWERIGEVVGGPGGGDTMAAASKWHNGQMWDYVIDVEMDEGGPPKKLALNRGDNPYDVADRFLAQENLAPYFREQIVQYILNVTQGTAAMPAPPSFNPDPYTGGNAYVPGLAPAAPAAGGGGFGDPLTGAGAYVPPPPGSNSASGAGASGGYTVTVTGGGADPFTGFSAGSSHHIPARAYLLYDAVPNTEGMRRKMVELSSQLAGDPTRAALALSEAEVAAGGALDTLLDSASRPPARSGKFSDPSLALLRKLLSWPAPQLFPALDLARLAALDGEAAGRLAAGAGGVTLESAAGGLGHALASGGSISPPVPANQQTALRLACNCFLHSPLLLWLQPQASALLDLYAGCAASSNKNVRQGLATLLLNLAVLLGKVAGEELEFKARILGLALELLSATPPDDVETRFRALVAVGTLARESGKVRGMCRDLGLLSLMPQLRSGGGKAGEAAAEAERVLRL